MKTISRNDIIELAKEMAEKSPSPLSRNEFTRQTGITQHYIYKFFPEGGWREVKRLAGMERHPKDMAPLSDAELLKEYHRVVSTLGYIPTWSVLDAKAQVSSDVIRKRFGGLRGTLTKYRDWLLSNAPESPLLEKLDLKSRHEMPNTTSSNGAPQGTLPTRWGKLEGSEFGPPISFRGLRHAPINEQGVVFLFGMISYELGFIVEAVHSSFPDCEAKRKIDREGRRWQRVLIEFEYRSKSFLEHGHDPTKCDLIVCWEHNWPECPIDVVELRSTIDSLEG